MNPKLSLSIRGDNSIIVLFLFPEYKKQLKDKFSYDNVCQKIYLPICINSPIN